MSIPALLDRLAKAKCADRFLDDEIAVALDLVVNREWRSIDYAKAGMIPAFTGSLDAAVGLMEQLLPGHGRMGSKGRCSEPEPAYAYQIFETDLHPTPEDMSPIGEAEHDVEAIALVIAILRAIHTRGAR